MDKKLCLDLLEQCKKDIKNAKDYEEKRNLYFMKSNIEHVLKKEHSK